MKYNKKYLADLLAEEKGLTKLQALESIDFIFDSIQKLLEEQKDVNIVGFGVFRSIQRPERIATNPQNGETFKLASRRVAKFELGKRLKNLYKEEK